MSFRFGAPHHFGILVRQEPTTGALVGPVWAADEVMDVQAGYPGQAAQHPTQGGGIGPSDVYLPAPETLGLSLRVSDLKRIRHPRPDWNAGPRIQRAVQELRDLRDEGRPLAVLVRGFDGLLRDFVLENFQVQIGREAAEATISAQLVRVRTVTLRTVPVEQDADLLALGSQVQATIGQFPSA